MNNPLDTISIATLLIDGTKINGTTKVKSGDKVFKIGTSTGRTEGTVTMINVKGNRGCYYYKEQIMVEIEGQEGDAGTLGLTENGNFAFGMVNGGEGKHLYFSDITNVFDMLNVELL